MAADISTCHIFYDVMKCSHTHTKKITILNFCVLCAENGDKIYIIR